MLDKPFLKYPRSFGKPWGIGYPQKHGKYFQRENENSFKLKSSYLANMQQIYFISKNISVQRDFRINNREKIHLRINPVSSKTIIMLQLFPYKGARMTRRKFLSELKRLLNDPRETVISYLIEQLKFVQNHMAKRPRPTEGEKSGPG